jgi:hypothetical protein
LSLFKNFLQLPMTLHKRKLLNQFKLDIISGPEQKFFEVTYAKKFTLYTLLIHLKNEAMSVLDFLFSIFNRKKDHQF